MSISQELQQVINSSRFIVHPGEWIYAKVKQAPDLDDCFMLTKDKDEITAVFEKAKANKFSIIEQNKDLRKLIELKVSVPFYSVGFLAAVSQSVAEQGLNILIISTYSKDYILINTEQLEDAKRALTGLGLRG